MSEADTKILVIGAFGQLGSELIPELVKRYGREQVIASDLQVKPAEVTTEVLDIRDAARLKALVEQYGITQIYHLAAILSAVGEQKPQLAWEVNMQGLLNVLELAVSHGIQRIFWPSSIAVFGPGSPRLNTPQLCPMDPTSMYGISKLAGERLCAYYHEKFGVDVRSLRYPGLIGYNAPPGGGTTDYALHIFYEALRHRRYTCFLQADARLPMMYMPDAVRATLELMEAPSEQITVHDSYNLGAIDFTPEELAAEIQRHMPEFRMDYEPDFRQQIAESWPRSIDDHAARRDWQWEPEWDLARMTTDMLKQIGQRELDVIEQN